ncbi:MAG: CopG family transcriptional regulator [Alphaproteobacteria bacterium]|nr:CopG family transcriptional regulator [Alphaproteobacteria bacterium]
MRRTLAVALVFALRIGAPAFAAGPEAVVYKDPLCSCCAAYAEYLGANGFAVIVVNDEDLGARHAAAGTPADYEGCHLTMIDGYAVEGHVPVAVIAKLLDERPDIAGITLPGMPEGSPGMGGDKAAPFVIYGFRSDGSAPLAYAVD